MFSDFNKNLFSQDQPVNIEIPSSADIIFVADMFSEDYCGGAEMTTDALIDSSPFEVFRLRSRDLTMSLLEQGWKKFWIFGNFSGMDLNLIPAIVGNKIKYSVLEYDYKYCRYRSPEKHALAENTPCGCHNEPQGKFVSAFYYGSKSLWWMSEKQMERYHTLFPFLGEVSNVVLSSVFDEKFFQKVQDLKRKYEDQEPDGWIVLGSTSWIKGAQDAEKWCQDNDKKYEIVWNRPYAEVLEKLAQAEGFVYLPKGGDTCPRMVIEAKLLGCQLKINSDVQHANEIWFDTEDPFDTEAYLYAARGRFWSGIKHDMSYSPTISGYATTLNCFDQSYPYEESIMSLLGFCDQVVVVDGGSKDGTWEKLQELSRGHEGLLVHQQSRDWNDTRFAVFDGAQKALARSLCTSDFCWQQDVDEVVHEDDYEKIKNLVTNFPKNVDLLALPVIEYWGGPEKARMDINLWKWRLSRNKPHITHGIPLALRKFDDEGNLYASPGTDGCDYVRCDSFEPIPFANFFTADVEQARQISFQKDNPDSEKYKEAFEIWFNSAVKEYPGVHHYSWFDISRKIRTYKNYWSKHWQSLYNIIQDDTEENNMFFDKSWSQVSEEDIDTLSERLSSEMGGWVFHTKLSFEEKTPHLTISKDHPEVMKDWIKK